MPQPFAFPTPIHRQAAETIVEFFANRPRILAVVLVNSCARGVAIPESDLDMAILVDPSMNLAERQLLERQWQADATARPVFARLKQLGKFSGTQLELFTGQWTPERWDEGGGPDNFEIEIGNQVAYAVPLWERGQAFADLRKIWLPYYGQPLQQERLGMVRTSCRLNIERLEFYVRRGLYFQAFDRLYHAFQEFLQAVFIARRVYPISYNKWIREQVVEWLNLPELYADLPAILEVGHLESDELLAKGERLRLLVERWTEPGAYPGGMTASPPREM
jgi:hypothetical protein